MRATIFTSDHLTNPNTFIKTLTLSFLALSFFFAAKHFSGDTTTATFTLPTPTISTVTSTVTTTAPSSPPPPSPPPPSPPPPPLEVVSRTGIVDENGAMSDEFVIGDYDAKLIANESNKSNESENENESVVENQGKVERFRVCDESKREYIPCLDNVDVVSKLNSTENGEKYERHCPGKGLELDCLVPNPKGYKSHIPWPKSRDEVVLASTLLLAPRLEDIKIAWWRIN